MADEELLAIIKLGLLNPSFGISEVWNEWRKFNPEIIPDLSEAKLRKFPLQNIDFSNCNLEKIDLNSANLESANLQNSNLQEAGLYKSNLTNANLEYADLQGADLDSTNFKGANLQKAYFQETNFAGANLEYIGLSKVIWFNNGAKGLKITTKELLESYANGRRSFRGLFIGDGYEKLLIGANLSGADFPYAYLSVNLDNTDLRDTNFTGCYFEAVSLNKADLRGATMIGV